jgi:hypothetical protein
MESSDAFELLHINEYIERFNVGRTTIFKWKREGILVPGRHYIQIGRTVRYIWALDVIREIHENSSKYKSEISNQQGMNSTTKKVGAKKNSMINFEY